VPGRGIIFDWCTNDNNLTSMEWVKEFLTNSCKINLVKHVDEKFDQLFEHEMLEVITKSEVGQSAVWLLNTLLED
jgi:hypothetical protein